MTKVYERTEDGVTTHVSVDEGMAEVHEAMLGRVVRERTTRTIDSTRAEHRIEYSDDRKVHLLLVDEPATVETDGEGRQIATLKGKRYVVSEITPARPDAEAFVTYQSGGLLGLPSGPTRTAKASMKRGTVGRAIWDAVGAAPEPHEAAKQSTESAAKVYKRTEDGVTTIVSLADGVAEAEAAYADRHGVPSMSSHKGQHHLEYRGGRIVDLVLVDAPAEEPKAAPVAPAGRAFTVIYTGAGEPIVHATGCSHNVRDSFQGAHTTEQITGSLTDVAAHVYADMIDEDEALTGEDFIGDLTVKPCAR